MIELRYLAQLEWKPEEAQKVTDHYLRWKPPEGLMFVLEPHTVIGGNKAVLVVECSDEALAKVDRYWRQVCSIHIVPVMLSKDLIKIKP